MLLACIVWLKLVSYAHTNYDMRNLSNLIDKEDTSCNYPNIDGLSPLDFKSLVYFMVAPTLCYQATYPRTACIRKSWVIRQSIKLVIFTGVMGFIVEQASTSVHTYFFFFLINNLILVYLKNIAVHKPYSQEFTTPFEWELVKCDREGFEAISSNFVCVALYVLLLFPSMVKYTCGAPTIWRS